MKYGYVRVSTVDKQEFTRQEFVLKDYAIDRLFEEKISGTKKACGREEFNKMLTLLQEGDEVYFESMSRMARSVSDLIDTTNLLIKEKKVRVIFIKENLTVGGGKGLDAMSALVFHIMSAFAQFERDLIADRTKQALEAKKAEGVKLGRKPSVGEDVAECIRQARGAMTYDELAVTYGVSRSTVARILRDAR